MLVGFLLSAFSFSAIAQNSNAPGVRPLSGVAAATRFPIVVGTNGAVLSPTQYLGMYLQASTSNTIAISNVVRDVINSLGGLTTTLTLGNATLKFSKGLLTNSTVVSWDSDALAFLGAASITDSTISNAVNTFATTAKTHTGSWPSGFWSSFTCIYPFVGGNSTAHSKNLKGSSFPITWNGTVTHDSTGITGNGTTGWGDTGYYPTNGTYAQDSATMLVYCATTTPTDSGCFIGCSDFGNSVNASAYRADPNFKIYGPNNAVSGVTQTRSDFRGPLGWTRSGSSAWALITQGGYTTQSAASTGVPTIVSIGILAENKSTGHAVGGFSNANLSFAMIGAGMTSGQYTEVLAAIQAFEGTLGRTAP